MEFIMAKSKKKVDPEVETEQALPKDPMQVLADVIGRSVSSAIETARPQKKTINDYVPKTPFDPPDGTPRAKLKRKMYQHGMPISQELLTNEEIELLNKVRPGSYCDG